jgi:predicted PurR-regulated permease PerM
MQPSSASVVTRVNGRGVTLRTARARAGSLALRSIRHNGAVTPQRWRAVLWGSMLLVVVVLAWRARSALLPFAFGAVLAYALTPIVDHMASVIPARSQRADVLRRGVVVFLLYVIAIALIAVAAIALIPLAVDQTTQFVNTLPSLLTHAREQSNHWLAQYHTRVPQDVQDRLDVIAQDATDAVAKAVGGWMRGSVGFVTQTLTALLTFVVVPVWMFWALRDRHFVGRNFMGAVPARARTDVENMLRIADQLMGRYIRGQLLLGLVVGLAVGVGLTLLRVQLSLALGVWAGVSELIPILGPWLGAIPGLIIVLATDPHLFVWVALLYIVVQQLENNLLVPRIQGHAVDIHPAMIILLLAVGGTAFGFLGLLVSVPLTAILRELFWYLDRRLRGEPPDDAFAASLIGRQLRRHADGGAPAAIAEAAEPTA